MIWKNGLFWLVFPLIGNIAFCLDNSASPHRHANEIESGGPLAFAIAGDGFFRNAKQPRPSATLEELTEKYKTFLELGLKEFVPLALRISNEAKLSSKCTQAVYKVIIGVRQLEDWAIDLLSASAKIQSGLLDGTTSDFGDFDQCISVDAKRDDLQGQSHELFTGQYCVVQFSPPPLFRFESFRQETTRNFTLNEALSKTNTIFKKLLNVYSGMTSLTTRNGICIPSVCTKDDLKKGLDVIFKRLEIAVEVLTCETQFTKYIGSDHIGFFTIFGVLFLMVAVGTIVDVVVGKKRHFGTRSQIQNDYCVRFWRSFSVLASGAILCDVKGKKENVFSCMKGIRVLTVLWIVLSNCYFFPYIGFFYRLKHYVSPAMYQNDIIFGLLSNPSPALDTLFCISGIMISYQAGKRFIFEGGELKLWKSFIRTFLRYLPCVLFTIWFFVMLISIGDGPQWNELVSRHVVSCRSTWWRSLLFIQNFWSFNENCMLHTWVISLLVQYSFLSIFLVSMLYKNSGFGIFSNIVIILGTAAGTAYINLQNNFPPNLSLAALDIDLYEKIMNRDHLRTITHIGPFCVGLLAGYIILKRQKINFHKVVLFFGWILCLFTFSTVIYGLHRFPYEGDLYSTLSAMYSSIHRIGWAISLSWICVICATGYGGVVNDILSWRFFVQLDHLSTYVYLLHPVPLYYFAGRARDRVTFGHPEMILTFLGILFLTLLLSILAYFFFMFPLKHIDAFLFETKKIKDDDNDKDGPDADAIISLYKSEGVASRKSSTTTSAHNAECSGVQVETYLRKKRNSSVVFKDKPEIMNEEYAQRRGSEAMSIGHRRKKSSLKNDADAQMIKSTCLKGEESTIQEESRRSTGSKNESVIDESSTLADDEVFEKSEAKSTPTKH